MKRNLPKRNHPNVKKPKLRQQALHIAYWLGRALIFIPTVVIELMLRAPLWLFKIVLFVLDVSRHFFWGVWDDIQALSTPPDTKE